MRKRLALVFLAVAGLAVFWVIGSRERWAAELPGAEPAYRSGRASLCKAPVPAGETWPSQTDDRGPQPLDRGAERVVFHTFEAAPFAGGAIDVCSEYGSVKIVGVDGTKGRVEITVTNPFPGGERAIEDTKVATDLRVIDGRLQIRVIQLTQGLTAFKTFFAKGNRLAALNVVVQVPRTGAYALHVVANHQRISVQNIDMQGVLEGYASPGADIDAGVDGPLSVRLSGVSYQTRWPGATNLDGGTTARLRPLRSGSAEFKVDEGDVRVEVVGEKVGGVQLDVRANTGKGSVAVTRSQR